MKTTLPFDLAVIGLLALGCEQVLGIQDTTKSPDNSPIVEQESAGIGGIGDSGGMLAGPSGVADSGGVLDIAGRIGGIGEAGGIPSMPEGFGGVSGQPSNVEAAGSSGEPGSESTSLSPMLVGAQWPDGVVPVCWDASSVARNDFALRSREVRDLANNSWPTTARVDFEGWGTCSASEPGKVRIILSDSTNADAGGIGYSADGRTMTLGVAHAAFEGALIPYEFGRILGLAHSAAEPDLGGLSDICPADAMTSDHPSVESIDQDSILRPTAFCRADTNPSLWDIIGAIAAYGRRTEVVSPLVTGWNDAQSIHRTVATNDADAFPGSGYSWRFAEGWLFTFQVPGTSPLNLYWNAALGESLSLATPEAQDTAIRSGFELIRTEGYVFSNEAPDTVPIKLYSQASPVDNWLTTSTVDEEAALAAGYVYVRTEGYIPQDVPYVLGWKYMDVTSTTDETALIAQNSPLAITLNDAGYAFVGFDCAFWKSPFAGTTPLQLYFSVERGDYFTLANETSDSVAQSFGYTFIGTQGYVYPNQVLGTLTMTSYWRLASLDNRTTTDLTVPDGYLPNRVEGYALPIEQAGN